MKCPSCDAELKPHCEHKECSWQKCDCGVVLNKTRWTKKVDIGYQETREL